MASEWQITKFCLSSLTRCGTIAMVYERDGFVMIFTFFEDLYLEILNLHYLIVLSVPVI